MVVSLYQKELNGSDHFLSNYLVIILFVKEGLQFQTEYHYNDPQEATDFMQIVCVPMLQIDLFSVFCEVDR